ncbi:hypothetical protein NPX13_g8476 [Xylaria arbuscula]|uniref:Uncharacterized protein n=1 Tax=Xylaria arbuscula TaxID=114810 RepID=A0A9W8N8N3_9PEZI|nr:hypothetical protein NPX13_g8476 [Xylaria arbuscula]
MQTPLQVSYPPSSRAPEPPPPQGPGGYARYAGTPSSAPVPGRDPRRSGPSKKLHTRWVRQQGVPLTGTRPSGCTSSRTAPATTTAAISLTTTVETAR